MKFRPVDFDRMPDQAQANWLAAARHYFNALNLTLRSAAELLDGDLTYGHIGDILHGERVTQPRRDVLVNFALKLAGLELEEFRQAGAMLRAGKPLPPAWRPRVKVYRRIRPRLVNGELSYIADTWEKPMVATGQKLTPRPSLASYVVHDRALEPVISPGTSVIVDTEDTKVKNNGLYLLAVGHELVVRRALPRDAGQGRTFRQFDARKVKGDYQVAENEARVMGRIVWWPPADGPSE